MLRRKQMKKIFTVTTALCVYLLSTPLLSIAGDFDGSKPLVCTVLSVSECLMDQGCREMTPEEVNLPRFLWINLSKKVIQSSRSGQDARTSKIESVKELDHKLMLQGAEQGREDVRDGFGWTIAIMTDTGEMVLTASGDLVGEVAFGVCTPQ
jgi:hypothetical protein